MTGTFKATNGTMALPSITFSNDPNTGLYREAADVIGFTAAGTRAATLDYDGVLTLYGGAGGISSQGGGQFFVNATDLVADIGWSAYGNRFYGPYANIVPLSIVGAAAQTAHLFDIKNSSGNVLFGVDSSGNVGIGTSTPTYALAVSGDINVTGSVRVNGTPIGGGSSQWTGTSTDIYFNSGNVAVGTSDTRITGARMTVDGGLVDTGLTSSGYIGAEFYGAHDGAYLSSPGNAIRIENSSNGIYMAGTGTGLLLDRLDKFLYSRSNGATNEKLFELTQDTSAFTGDGLNMNFANGSGSFTGNFINLQTNSNTVFTIKSDGSVGIGGTTTPGYPLDVIGDINSTTRLRISGTQVCTVAGCTSSSDERLKENIQPLQNSLEKILALEGVSYVYKDKEKFGDKNHVGVIAQKVEKIYPEVVVTDPKTGFKSVAYDHLVAPIIEAIKSIFNRLTHVERGVSSLQTENEKLKNENAELKQYLCSKDPSAPFCN